LGFGDRSVGLEAEVKDQRVWKFHSSQWYVVISAYNNLTDVAEIVHNEGFNHV